jgi:DNA-binding NarL/FixJ family response regulator
VLSPDAVSRTPAFVLLADAPSVQWTADALRSGARSVLPRDATPDEIIAALEAAAVGLVTLLPAIAADFLSRHVIW